MKNYDLLSTDELARGRAVLVDALNGADPSPWVKRLVLGDDGVFRLGVRYPATTSKALRHSEATEHASMPSEREWLEDKEVAMDIAQAVALLDDPTRSPERILETRRRVIADDAERKRLADEAAGREQTSRAAAMTARARQREEFRGPEWDRLWGWQRAFYRLALIYEKHGMPAALVADIRALAGDRPHTSVKDARQRATSDPLFAALEGPSGPPLERWWP